MQAGHLSWEDCLGIGAGFLWGNIPAGTLIGLGLGFILMGLVKLIWKK